MNVLVTGAGGFVGQNLCIRLSREKDFTILPFDVANEPSELLDFLREADRIVHLAGINRPLEPSEFMAGNFGLTSTIVEALEKMQRSVPIVFSSSMILFHPLSAQSYLIKDTHLVSYDSIQFNMFTDIVVFFFKDIFYCLICHLREIIFPAEMGKKNPSLLIFFR